MSVVSYRIAQDFLKIEAIGMRGARHGDPSDPTYLRVYVTAADDINDIYEDVTMGPATAHKLWRAKTGTWVFELDPGVYQAGRRYTAQFRIQMTPGNDNVVRSSFTWNPLPEMPHDDNNTVVFGLLADFIGVPVANERIVVEQYRDFVALTRRTGLAEISSDAFGYWWVEVPRKALCRFVLGEQARVVLTPDQDRVSLSALPEWQPDVVGARLDSFGYPLP